MSQFLHYYIRIREEENKGHILGHGLLLSKEEKFLPHTS